MLLAPCLVACSVLPCSAQPEQGPTVEQTLADFEEGSLDGWQSSMSGDYYQGGHGQKGLSIVPGAERGGRTLEAKIHWADANASEPAFITYFLPEPVPAHLIQSVSFAYHLSSYHLDDRSGFKVRLRYSQSSFTDYSVSTGDRLPVGEWRDVTLDTRPGSNVRNIYGTLFGSVQELTFRLDDVDAENAEFALRIDDIRLQTRQPLVTTYAPKAGSRPTDDCLDILYLKHSAEGFFGLEEAARFVADVLRPAAEPGSQHLRIDTHLFRGLHFPFFDFPPSKQEVLAYDLIVMLDVDPYVLTWEQATWIADAVASGAGMLFVAGPNTLAHSKDFKPPIAAVLPATFEPEAADQPGGLVEIAAPGHAAVAGLPPDRLGRVGMVAAVQPRADSQVVLTTARRPLLVVGSVGRGRTGLLTTWPQPARTTAGQFCTDDCSGALLEQIIGWLAQAPGPAPVSAAIPPPRSVIGEADVECSLVLSSDVPRTFTVQWSRSDEPEPSRPEPLRVDGDAEVSRTFHLAPVAGPQEPVELSALVADADGHPLARRSFCVRALPLVKAEAYVWHGNRAFAPGRPVQCGVALSAPGTPHLSVSGAGASISLPDSDLPIGLPTMADLWVFQPGTDSVYHSFSGGEVLGGEEGSEGLLSWAATDALLRAVRSDGNVFGEDDRIATVRRTLRVQAGGVVRCRYEYEFVRDVRVKRMPVLLTLPVGRYAGTPYTVVSAEGTAEGVLPRDEDAKRDTIADVHGLDLTLDTGAGPLQVRWDAPDQRAWLRDLRKYDMADYRLELESPFADREARAGDTYGIEFEVRLPTSTPPAPSIGNLQVTASLRQGDDFARGETVWELGTKPAEALVEFAAVLPDLESGQYWLEFLIGEPGGSPVASDAIACQVVGNLDRGRFFPLISILDTGTGGHLLNEAGARARVDDLWNTGFNTMAYGGVSRFQGQRVTGTQTHVDKDAESYAFSRGMASILEYTHYTRLSGRGGAGEPNPFSPESTASTREHIQPYLDVADSIPRLLSVKVVDEPTVSESAIDFGEHSQRAFRERYGGELRPSSEIVDDAVERLHLAQFLSDYVAEQYRQGYEAKHEADRTWDLLLTYMSPGLGYGRAFSGQEDALKWSRYVDRIDFDVYPYFYPTSQKIRMVQANYCHAFQRGIAQHLGRPFGFYVELDDRNYPFQINPKEASAECAYTAIGQGVTYLNSFINRSFGTGVQSRPERWAFLAGELPRIRRLGPLLNVLRRPMAPVALLYPMTQARINNGYSVPHYTFALLNGAFGDVDLLHEEVLLESGIPQEVRALVLLRTDLLARETYDALLAFVRNGGLLIVDGQIPATDERGEPLGFPFEASAREELGEVGARLEWMGLGDGTIARLAADVEELVRAAVEGDDPMSPDIADPAAFAAWHEVVRGILDGHRWSGTPALPAAVAIDDTAQVEVGVRSGEDTTMLVVTNHDVRDRQAAIRLPRLPHPPGFVCDLREMRPADRLVKRRGDAVEVEVRLEGRHSTMLGIYPDRPTAIRVSPKQRAVRRGDEIAYDLEIEAAGGRPARGVHLVEVTVTDAEGVVRERYGGGFAVKDGRLAFAAPLAINAAPGQWRIEARLPAVGESTRAAIKVE